MKTQRFAPKDAKIIREHEGATPDQLLALGLSKKAYQRLLAQQQISMLKLLLNLKARYPEAVILGHNNFPNVHKACPSFNVAEWLSVM